MSTLGLIEAASGGPFRVRLEGFVETLPDPADLDFQIVLAALQVECVPGSPAVPLWKQRQLARAWAAHYDLPEFASAQRLAYLLDRYRSAIVYDLHHYCNIDMGELWRARRWRTLLDLIDHLPSWSWYSAAVYGDEEHADMLAKSMQARSDEGDKSNDNAPSMNNWTPEVSAITALHNSVRDLIYLTSGINGGKGPAPKPLPTPRSPLEAAIKRNSFHEKKAKHDALVARLLPHKAERAH